MSDRHLLLEMPQHWPSPNGVVYQADGKFDRYSLESIERFKRLGSDEQFIYCINNDSGTTGFVFSRREMDETKNGYVLPVMVVRMRKTESPHLHGMLQPHGLRIRKSWAENKATSNWYRFYAEENGGIVSDFDHLPGGKALWQSFIRTGKVTALDVDTGAEVEAVPGDESHWSTDASKRNIVLIYRP